MYIVVAEIWVYVGHFMTPTRVYQNFVNVIAQRHFANVFTYATLVRRPERLRLTECLFTVFMLVLTLNLRRFAFSGKKNLLESNGTNKIIGFVAHHDGDGPYLENALLVL